MSRTRVRDALVAAGVLLLGRRKPPPPDVEERIVPEGPPDPRAELWANALLLLAAVCAAAFVAVYALDRLPRYTQLLGAALGLALLLIAAALIVIAKRLIVSEELEEEYSPEHPEEQ